MSEVIKLINSFEKASSSSNSLIYKNARLQKDILTHFINYRKVTITELSNYIKISIPKVKAVLNDLISKGLIRDLGKENVGVGRQPNFYGLNPEAAFFLSVEIHRHFINLAIVDFDENIVTIQEHISYHLENSKQSFEELCTLIQDYLDKSALYKNKIIGLGVTITGRINNETGESFSFFNIFDKSLSKTLEERFEIFTYIENDSRAIAFGEYSKGCVGKEKDILYLYLDEGIGTGIIIDGKLYSGKSGYAGEFGHLPIFQNDILCQCGKKGCLETEASGLALMRELRIAVNDGTTTILSEAVKNTTLRIDSLVDAALKDDVLSIELISKAGKKIGKGIAILLNLFNPELVILGGELSRAKSTLLIPILASINKYSLNLINNDTEFKFATLGSESGLIGISLLLRNRMLSIS